MPTKKKEIIGKMTFGEAMQIKPEAIEIFLKSGMHCIGCGAAAFETIEQGALAHGMSEKDIKKMLKEINEV